MPWKTLITITSLTILIAIALIQGINGAVLASGMALIAGIGGYTIAKHIKS